MMLAPVSYIPNYGVVISPDAPILYAQLTTNQMAFNAKPKNKKGMPAPETHRAGDWVCILCHNLNYSFRKVCNRCQVQTKRDNLIQSLSMLSKTQPSDVTPLGCGMNVAPPGLDKVKETVLRKEADLFVLPENATHSLCNPEVSEEPEYDHRMLITPKKNLGNLNIPFSNSTKASSSDGWTSNFDRKGRNTKQSTGEVHKEDSTHKPFQLFEVMKLHAKEVNEFTPSSRLKPSDCLNHKTKMKDEILEDSNILRSVDCLLEDCQE